MFLPASSRAWFRSYRREAVASVQAWVFPAHIGQIDSPMPQKTHTRRRVLFSIRGTELAMKTSSQGSPTAVKTRPMWNPAVQ